MASVVVISTLFAAAPAGAIENPAVSATATPTSSPAVEPALEPTPTVVPTPTVEPNPTVATIPTGESAELRSAAVLPATGPVAASRPVIDAAASWLAGQLSDVGTVTVSFDGDAFTDYGRSLDSALALLAAQGQDEVLRRTLTSVEQPDAVAEYTRGVPFDAANAAYVGATAKLAFLVELTGGDASRVGGVDLLAQLLSLAQADGRFADRSDFGNFANLFGHAFALLALDTAGRTPATALVQGLFDAQCPDGSFPESYEPGTGGTCTGQVDATGLVLQALGALDLGADDRTRRAAAWLIAQQQPSGAFPGEAPVNSTGYAVLGLNAVDPEDGGAVAYLVSQQNPDGGLRRGAGEDTSSDLFATAQALPALAGTTFQGSARDVRSVAEPAPTEPTPTPSPTAVTTASPSTAPGVAPTVAASPTPATQVRSAGSNLPRTGADSADVLLAGVVLVAVGGAILAAARPPRRGRHAA